MTIENFRILDNHFHLRTDGLYLDAVKAFKKAGGDIINLVNLPDYTIPTSEYYEHIYERTLRMAEFIRTNSEVKVMVTLGPYPLDYFYFRQASVNPVKKMTDGIMLLEKYAEDKTICAIGEIGRPHFDVDLKVREESNQILLRGLHLAADYHIPAILHTEDLDEAALFELQIMGNKSGISPHMIIKHHATVSNLMSESALSMSVLATRPNLRGSIETGKSFLLETDYVDDPLKPGKVIAPDSVPKRALMIRGEYTNYEKIMSDVFLKLPSKIYGKELFEI